MTFAYEKQPAVGTRIHMPADDAMEVFLGATPALRKAGHYNDKAVYNWQMPHLIARRRSGEAGLKSVFVAVYDLFAGGPRIQRAQRLDAGGGGVGLRVELGDRVDTLLMSLEGPRLLSAGGMQIRGLVGLVCEQRGKADAYLVGGTRLRKGDLKLTAATGAYAGTIVSASRTCDGAAADTFVTPADLPPGTALRGSWMIVTHGGGRLTHGYRIDRVETAVGRSVVHLAADHGLRISRAPQLTREVFSKWRSFKGPDTFVIHTHAATAAAAVIEPNTGPPDRLNMQRFVPFVGQTAVALSAPRGRAVHYTTDGSAPTAASPRYSGPFVLRRSATVKAVVPDPRGLQKPRIAVQRFQAALTPKAVAAPRPGLTYRDTEGTRPGRTGVAAAFDTAPAPRGKQPGRTFDGLIRVPQDGIYTFHVQSAGGTVLSVGGRVLVDNTGLGPFKEWSARVALKAGLHPIRLTHRYPTGRGASSALRVSYAGGGAGAAAPPRRRAVSRGSPIGTGVAA